MPTPGEIGDELKNPLRTATDRCQDGTGGVTRRKFLASSAVLVALPGGNTPPAGFLSRLTLVIDTPEGERTGSSVIEHKTVFQDGWLGRMSGHFILLFKRGEAVVVDLQARGLLFALLTGDDTRPGSFSPDGIVSSVFSNLYNEADKAAGPDGVKRLVRFFGALNRLKPKGNVPAKKLPLLVRFRDPNDPRTVERVGPLNLATTFGAGVKLKTATMEIVDEPVTRGIEKRLPWLLKSHETDKIVLYKGPWVLAGTRPLMYELPLDAFWSEMK